MTRQAKSATGATNSAIPSPGVRRSAQAMRPDSDGRPTRVRARAPNVLPRSPGAWPPSGTRWPGTQRTQPDGVRPRPQPPPAVRHSNRKRYPPRTQYRSCQFSQPSAQLPGRAKLAVFRCFLRSPQHLSNRPQPHPRKMRHLKKPYAPVALARRVPAESAPATRLKAASVAGHCPPAAPLHCPGDRPADRTTRTQRAKPPAPLCAGADGPNRDSSQSDEAKSKNSNRSGTAAGCDGRAETPPDRHRERARQTAKDS